MDNDTNNKNKETKTVASVVFHLTSYQNRSFQKEQLQSGISQH